MKISKYTSYFANRIFESHEYYPRQYRGIVFLRKFEDKSGWYGYSSNWNLSPIFSNKKEIYLKKLKNEIESPMPKYLDESGMEKAKEFYLEDRKFNIEAYQLFEKLPFLQRPKHLTGIGGLKMAKRMIDEILEENDGLEDKIKKIIKESK